MTATGRLNSQDPNLQNIPIRTERGQEIRKAFVPRNQDYLLLSADYSQIELRIIAGLSREAGLLEAFRTGVDVHTEKYMLPVTWKEGATRLTIAAPVTGSVQLLDGATVIATVSHAMTPAYAAPEFFNDQASRWSDQYSLAVAYCQMRGGRLPFAGSVRVIKLYEE